MLVQSATETLGLTHDLGKGTQAPKIKEKYCACHLVNIHDPI